ncbi:MAG: ATP-dependent Clp protease ATP-binding subunit, partial [Bacteroidaceae bacterium]|nr:ATP-dependent Clp protease ATP-binding subunit [Bacteroidaceae bacterium]
STPDYAYSSPSELSMNETASRILKLCILEAQLLKSKEINTEHVLLAILKENNNMASKILNQNEITYNSIFSQLKQTDDVRNGMDFADDEDDEEFGREKRISSTSQDKLNKNDAQKSQSKTPVTDNFGTDLTKAASEGKLDPVVGREREIERIAQILSRRKKNNPILIGEPGVGKSAIIEGLATRIAEKKVPLILQGKRIIMLDITSVVAGTKYRGQFEERIKAIINELEKNPDVIIFIDEIHTMIGAGSAPGSMDAANILKPALARGQIQCVGATTLDEYKKSIEKDGALDRRFQKVIVEPTTTEETIRILNNIKDRYEEHHNVTYTNEAIEACAKLAERYISDRFFPDKAIDVLDEAGARIHLTNITVPKEIKNQELLIEQAKQKKNNAVKSQNYELAASFRDQELSLEADLRQMTAEWEKSLKTNRQTVDEEQIASVVSLMSGIPVQRIAQTESIRLKGMRAELLSKVIGQDSAIDKIVHAIQRSRVGLSDPKRPIGTFMFLGPTGVGKTYLAKQLAQFMFGSEDSLIRVDMSEFMEKHTVSRLVGAPPGYVGYEEGGQLTDKVRRKPYSIILLDEIEKANPDVFNILLQIMDEGRLTDNFGRTVDFKNTIIIMTSNCGSRQIKDFGNGIGFSINQDAANQELSRSLIQKALNKQFAPEFLNRLDEIITFDQLDAEAIRKVIEIELRGFLKRTSTIGYEVSITDAAKDFLAQKGYDKQFGARPLRRAIQNHIEDPMSELIIEGAIGQGSNVTIDHKQGDEKLSFQY